MVIQTTRPTRTALLLRASLQPIHITLIIGYSPMPIKVPGVLTQEISAVVVDVGDLTIVNVAWETMGEAYGHMQTR